MTDEKMSRVQLVIAPSQIAEIDTWRGRQPGVPNRSEAIRQLVSMGLQASQSPDPTTPSEAGKV